MSEIEDLQASLAEIQAKMAEMQPDAILARVREMASPDVARVLDAPPLPPAPASSSSPPPAAASDAPADYDPWSRDPSVEEFSAMSQAEMAAVENIRGLAASGQSTLDDRMEAQMRWASLRQEHNARRETAAAEAAREAEIEASPALQLQRVAEHRVAVFRSQIPSLSARDLFIEGSDLGVFDRTPQQLREAGYSSAEVAKITSIGRRIVQVDPERYGLAGTVERGDGRYTVVPFGEDLDETVGRYGLIPGESSGEAGSGGE